MRRLFSLVVLAALVAPLAADDTKLKVKVGDAFPDVPLAATQIEQLKKDAKTVSIKDLKGKIAVVFFYPRAMTPGCTVESCGFRDIAKDFPKDVVILGASSDTVAKNDEFTKKETLTYPLLCDTDLQLIQSLGIQSPKGKVAQRLTFVIDRDGKIAKIYEKVTPKEHPKEVLAFVKELAAKK